MSAAVLTAGAVIIPAPAVDSPDADLIRLATEYVALSQENYRLGIECDGAAEGSPEQEQLKAVIARLLALPPTIAALPAITEEGRRAKAAVVLHQLTSDVTQLADGPDEADDAPAHSLALDLLRSDRPIATPSPLPSPIEAVADRLEQLEACLDVIGANPALGDADTTAPLTEWWALAEGVPALPVATAADLIALGGLPTASQPSDVTEIEAAAAKWGEARQVADAIPDGNEDWNRFSEASTAADSLLVGVADVPIRTLAGARRMAALLMEQQRKDADGFNHGTVENAAIRMLENLADGAGPAGGDVPPPAPRRQMPAILGDEDVAARLLYTPTDDSFLEMAAKHRQAGIDLEALFARHPNGAVDDAENKPADERTEEERHLLAEMDRLLNLQSGLTLDAVGMSVFSLVGLLARQHMIGLTDAPTEHLTALIGRERDLRVKLALANARDLARLAMWPTAPTPANPDAALIADCAAFDALERQSLATFATPAETAADDEPPQRIRDQLRDKQEPLFDRIIDARALTLAGLQAKVRSMTLENLEIMKAGAVDWTDCFVTSICQDILALPGDTPLSASAPAVDPDATLRDLCRQLEASVDQVNASEEDFEPGSPIDVEQRRLLTGILGSVAVTIEGHRDRARAYLAWTGGIGGNGKPASSFDGDEMWPILRDLAGAPPAASEPNPDVEIIAICADGLEAWRKQAHASRTDDETAADAEYKRGSAALDRIMAGPLPITPAGLAAVARLTIVSTSCAMPDEPLDMEVCHSGEHMAWRLVQLMAGVPADRVQLLCSLEARRETPDGHTGNPISFAPSLSTASDPNAVLATLAEEVKAAETVARLATTDEATNAACDRSHAAMQKMLQLTPSTMEGFRACARAALWEVERSGDWEINGQSWAEDLLWVLARGILGGDEPQAFLRAQKPDDQAPSTAAVASDTTTTAPTFALIAAEALRLGRQIQAMESQGHDEPSSPFYTAYFGFSRAALSYEPASLAETMTLAAFVQEQAGIVETAALSETRSNEIGEAMYAALANVVRGIHRFGGVPLSAADPALDYLSGCVGAGA